MIEFFQYIAFTVTKFQLPQGPDFNDSYWHPDDDTGIFLM